MHKLTEFIGIMLGDGYLVDNRLKITLNSITDFRYLYYVNTLVKQLFNTKPIIKFRKNENTVDLFVFKRKVLNRLENYGLLRSPKWGRAVIPKNFLKYGLDVLRGYFDTDGSLVMAHNNGILYPRLEMKVCPSPMQKQFIDILKVHGFKFGAYKIGKGKIRIQLNGKEQLKKWMRLIGFSNEKHIDKTTRFI